MKKASLLPIFILLFTIGGCSSDDPKEIPEEVIVPQIEIISSETIPTFPADGGSIQFYFTSNVDWTAYVTTINGNSIDWCDISPTSGKAGYNVLTITSEQNDSYDNRSASFTIKAENVTKDFTVLQKQENTLFLTLNNIEVGANDETIKIEVHSNVDYNYIIDDAAKMWISKTNTRAFMQHNETFNVAANTSTTKREGKITFYSGDLSETVTVVQSGKDVITGSSGINDMPIQNW